MKSFSSLTLKNLQWADIAQKWADELDVESGPLSGSQLSELDQKCQWIVAALQNYDIAIGYPDHDTAIDGKRDKLVRVQDTLNAKKDKNEELNKSRVIRKIAWVAAELPEWEKPKRPSIFNLAPGFDWGLTA
ncbi:hypothetical protein F4811DRAFT_552227 [Daldinia bambusicola]|nr:hypothetical protein F4811DRAFT_552227 [Daldinia bambusicola]